MTTTTKLVCPECQRPNEPERIYCHDCGARLDRSSLAKVTQKSEDPQQTQRRLKQLLDPGRAKTRLIFFRISKVILGSCVLAALIQIFLPPDNLPERVKNLELVQLNLELEKAVATHSTAPLQFSDDQVNNFLYNLVKTKQSVLSNYLKFERALIIFDEGVCRVTVERSFAGYSIFQTISYQVSLENGTLTASCNGGKLGRLLVHPALMKYGDLLFQDLWTILDPQKKMVARMGAIEFHPKAVILLPKQIPQPAPSA